MRKFAYLVIASLLMGLSLQAQAAKSNFEYDYVEIGYSPSIDTDRNVDGTAIRFGGSIDVANNFNLIAGMDLQDLDNSTDGKLITFGGGYHQAINQQADIVASVLIVEAEYDAPGNTDDDSGYMLSGGIRYALNNKVELSGDLTYLDIFGDSNVGIRAGGRYKFNQTMSVGGMYEDVDVYDRIEVNFRVEF